MLQSNPPCLRQRGHGQEWEGSVEKSTNQRQHSQGNRPDVLGTSNPELENQGHAMSKHSRARSHHSLHISDPCWATPTTTPLGQVKTNPSGLPNIMHRPHWANRNFNPHELPVRVAKYETPLSSLHHCVSQNTSTEYMVAKYQQRLCHNYEITVKPI
ncbi:hypothetical protein AVEN_116752-1 [Araneus ventricosus]|uniref:Uncharacterized protein n=1 Tax=Araneus ventricosus TaxID=182803 RepID=A0A4Y2QCS9_ARAVE|nr:hypothetical protein AVEN_116752-1 [Araneus ventricosus]